MWRKGRVGAGKGKPKSMNLKTLLAALQKQNIPISEDELKEKLSTFEMINFSGKTCSRK